MKPSDRIKERRIKNKSRGQMEVFGLAVIVILISIGFFIYVSYKVQQKPPNVQKEYTNDKLANDFVLSILDVNVRECNSFTIKDLAIDCARDHRIQCGTKDSCYMLNKTINTLLNRTFMSMDTKFRFFSENIPVGTSGNELINITYLGCASDSVQGQRGRAIISLYPVQRNIYLNMNICYS